MQQLGALLGSSLKSKKNPPPKQLLISWEMELSSSNIKISYIFLYAASWCTFRLKLEKQKRSSPKTITYIFGNGTF